MEISKTAFKEYARCQRVLLLERLYLKKMDAESYFNDEQKAKMRELLSAMFSIEEGEDLLREEDSTQEALLSYYSDVEKWALECAKSEFGLEFVYHPETKNQKCFRFTDRYQNTFYCYLDGFGENDSEVVVIEVKATTSRKFQTLGPKVKGKVTSLFKKRGNIYRLRHLEEADLDKFESHFQKLFDPYSAVGAYVFDIAVERYIIENSILQNHPELKGKEFKYYLAVLNSDYVFSGEYNNDVPLYVTAKDNALISFIDLTEITKEYLPLIDKIRENISRNIQNPFLEEAKIGSYCEFGKRGGCIFAKICFPELYQEGAITEYMNFRGIKGHGNEKYSKFDLINQQKRKLTDIPRDALSNINHLIQRECFEKEEEYINPVKIEAGLKELNYPLYYLDFESFPCPLPRFRGEKPYSQSLFQYSVHIEKEPGLCDEIADNYYYLAEDFSDCREELVKSLIATIDLSKGGTVIVYNKSFEENRIKELMKLFPKYKAELNKILASLFDLMDLIKTNRKFYEQLGFSEQESKTINYYHKSLGGRYSIKKVLPLFSDLNYADLNVKNGTDAIAAYASFKHLPPEDIEIFREDLLKYCRLDTWSMVVILNNLKMKLAEIKKM